MNMFTPQLGEVASRASDIADRLDGPLTQRYGSGLYVVGEAPSPQSAHDLISKLPNTMGGENVPGFTGDWTIIPIESNLTVLMESGLGTCLGVCRIGADGRKVILPGIIGMREDGLHATVLSSDPVNRKHPADLNPLQCVMFGILPSLQAKTTGAHSTNVTLPKASELGHGLGGLSTMVNGAINDRTLHTWAESSGGIGPQVGGGKNGKQSIFTVRLNGQDWPIEIEDIKLPQPGVVLVDHSAFHGVQEQTIDVPAGKLAFGMGVIGVGSQLGIDLGDSAFKAGVVDSLAVVNG